MEPLTDLEAARERRELESAVALPHRLRDMRSARIGIDVCPVEWTLDWVWSRDGTGALYSLHLGPLVLTLELHALSGMFAMTAAELVRRRERADDDDFTFGL